MTDFFLQPVSLSDAPFSSQQLSRRPGRHECGHESDPTRNSVINPQQADEHLPHRIARVVQLTVN